MLPNYSVSKYGSSYAIFCAHSKCFVLFGTKSEMKERCRQLNAEDNKIKFAPPSKTKF